MIILDRQKRILGDTSYIDSQIGSNSINFYGETTSTTYVDCDAYPEYGYIGSYSFKLAEATTALILVSSPMSISLAGKTVSVAINIDGDIYEPIMSLYSSVNNGFSFVSTHLLLTLSATEHTIKMQIKVDGGEGAALRGWMTVAFLSII